METTAPTFTRTTHMARLAAEGPFDLVVIGGGIVGAGVAQDVAGRGLKVALIERSDFGSGTSSRSTKLIHGGIRYLPQLRFGLVRAGLKEQRILAETADYLYEPLEFVIPIYRGRGFAAAPRWARHPRIFPIALRLGLSMYDLLGGRIFGKWRRYRHRTISAEQAIKIAPGLRAGNLVRAVTYWDAQTDDARLVLAALKTACEIGASVAVNWAEVTDTRKTEDGFLVTVLDRLGGGTIEVTGNAVVAATGAFAPPADGDEVLRVMQSKGVHITIDAADIGIGTQAVVLPETEDQRVLYVVPWQGTAVVGTTDTPYDGDTAHPTADAADIDYLLRHVRQYFHADGVEPISAWAGLRALVDVGAGKTSEASREHKTIEMEPGFFQVAGGKLTGYRKIAADVVDGVGRHTKSTSDGQQLVGSGAEDWTSLANRLGRIGLGDEQALLMHRRYGVCAADVTAMLEARPDLRRVLGDGSTLADVAYGAQYESVATLSDFTLRRTRLSLNTADHGRNDAEPIADVLAAELGWDDDEKRQQLDRFEQQLNAEGL